MTKEERQKIYNQAEEVWGKISQYDQCIEEMAELTVAISKYKRKVLHNEQVETKKVMDNLIEEIADVKMCLEQMINYVGEENVNNVLEEKMQKLIGQIETAKKQKN